MKSFILFLLMTKGNPAHKRPNNEEMVTLVSPSNFARAESDENFRKIADTINRAYPGTQGVNTFLHYRTLDSPFNPIVRQNRDTLYSMAVLDTASGPLEITLPDTFGRYQSVYCLNQNHYQEYYATAPAIFKLKRQFVSTRYIFCIVRTLVTNFQSETELDEVHALQDKLKITANQTEVAKVTLPEYDQESLRAVRDGLKGLDEFEDTAHSFGKEHEVNQISHVIGAAGGWGGLPQNIATYKIRTVDVNDGYQEYELRVPAQVPVDAFWSVTVYDEDGYFFHRVDSTNLNQFTVEKEQDGSCVINFTNDPLKKNMINIKSGWSYTVRLYEPQLAILTGKWEFPSPQPVSKVSQL